jgi:hypothetical protein
VNANAPKLWRSIRGGVSNSGESNRWKQTQWGDRLVDVRDSGCVWSGRPINGRFVHVGRIAAMRRMFPLTFGEHFSDLIVRGFDKT